MKKELVLVKLGGGVITDKKIRYGLKEKRLVRLAQELGEAWMELKTEGRLIVGNGAGSFAHFSAKKYGTKNGFNNEREAVGAGWVHWDAVKLNQIVVESLLRERVPAFSLSPASMMVQIVPTGPESSRFPGGVRDDKSALGSVADLSSWVWVGEESLRVGIEKGLVPVVYGDVILDEKQGSTIFSTEKVFATILQQMSWLRDQFGRVRVIQVGLEKGVMRNGEVIGVISRDNWEEVKNYLEGSEGVDVTGGMWHKVEMSLELVDLGVETWIVSGLEKGRVKRAILGGEVEGTKIVKNSK